MMNLDCLWNHQTLLKNDVSIILPIQLFHKTNFTGINQLTKTNVDVYLFTVCSPNLLTWLYGQIVSIEEDEDVFNFLVLR